MKKTITIISELNMPIEDITCGKYDLKKVEGLDNTYVLVEKQAEASPSLYTGETALNK